VTDDEVDQQFAVLCEEMIRAWRAVPAPPPIPIPEPTRAVWSDVGAAAVVWGWTARVARTAEAALRLHREGFDVESAPLLRSMLEHAMAIFWLADKRGAAYQALARERANAWTKFHDAQTNGWALQGEAAELLREAMVVETDGDTLSEDRLLATAHRAAEYGFGQIFQGWLIETWSTHATMMSAEPYFDHVEGKLFHVAPGQHRKVAQTIALALHVAFTGYEQLTKNAFGGQLAAWEAQFVELLEKAASGGETS
jgi:hypothetical protein